MKDRHHHPQVHFLAGQVGVGGELRVGAWCDLRNFLGDVQLVVKMATGVVNKLATILLETSWSCCSGFADVAHTQKSLHRPLPPPS